MKLAFITGGSKGLGKALVEKYSNKNFKVYEFSRSGKSENNIRCDFAFPKESARIFEKTMSGLSENEFSEIILINNAGTLDPIGPVSGFGVERLINHININLSSSIIMSGIFVKHFQNHSGKKIIASISSGAATRSKHGWSLYCAAKAGLEQFCRTLALEQKSQDNPINTIIIDPGIIDTDMQAAIRSADESLFPELSRFVDFKEDGLLRNPMAVADKIYSIFSDKIENGAKYTVNE